MLSEQQLIADYEELMGLFEADDEWDLPPALYIRWVTDDPDMKGCVVVIPTEDVKDFLHMLLGNGPADAQEVFRGIGEVPDDTEIASIALVNEGWGVSPKVHTTAQLAAVERGDIKISDLPDRIEVRLCLVVTREKGVYFGEQERGDHFKWISRTDNPDGGSAGGVLPYLLYPLVTGEPYSEPEALANYNTGGINDLQDLRHRNAHPPQ